MEKINMEINTQENNNHVLTAHRKTYHTIKLDGLLK